MTVMTRRGGTRSGAGIWWVAGLLVLAALALLWWLARAPVAVPPAGGPALATPAPAVTAPAGTDAAGTDAAAGSEITDEEKAELQRILRERAGRPGPTNGDR